MHAEGRNLWISERKKDKESSIGWKIYNTLWLLHSRSHTRQKINWSHVWFEVTAAVVRNLDRCEIPKYFIRRRKTSDSVLIFNNLNEWESQYKVKGENAVSFGSWKSAHQILGHKNEVEILLVTFEERFESFYVWWEKHKIITEDVRLL